jgi:hypothetical protein
MTESLTISKAPFPYKSMDFAALREAGIKYFEKMGTKLWTDFNLHDPGITILEVLCYAITDLGYRTNFPIEDILASPANYPDKKQFFTALEVLTCNPVTPNDFRKILIDLAGIKNAWFVRPQQQEMQLYSYKETPGDAKTKWLLGYTNNEHSDTTEVKLNGLYDVYIDLDDSIDHTDGDKVDDIINCAWQKLWKHRNLCEDYVSVKVIEEMEFCIDLQVDLCPDADVNEVAGKIFYSIQEFLTPTIQFYSFKEMYEGKKRSCDEIFEGPVLYNGFIDDDELNKAQLRKEIYKSDLWQVVMNVCGVAAIKKLRINICDDGTGDPWCLPVGYNQKPKLNLKNSRVAFQKEFDCVFADEEKVAERITLLQKLNKPSKKSHDRPSLSAGTDRDLEKYFTIMEEFPVTYKIGDGQITSDDTELRKAQVKQLKGYLLLFDELLADYLLLLSRIRDLLSISQPEEHTYFYHDLYDIPGVRDIVKAANRLTVNETTIKNWEYSKIIPADTKTALKEFSKDAGFKSEKDFIYQLSLILCDKEIKSYEPRIVSQLQKNDEGRFVIVKNDDYENLTPDIRNEIDILTGDSYKDEKQFLAEFYIGYCSVKIKKYYRHITGELAVSSADESSWDVFKEDDKNQFTSTLKKLVETETKRKQRKNVFLDHLLARFGESFTDYIVKIYEEQCNCLVSPEGISIDDKLLKIKAAFLQEIPVLSSERGKGFNYKAQDCGKPDVWDTINVAGLKKRVSKYLGYNDYTRKTLTCPPDFEIVPERTVIEGKVQKYRLKLKNKKEGILLEGTKDYRQRPNAVKDAKDLREQILRHKEDSTSDLSTGIVVIEPADPGYFRVFVKDKEDNYALQSNILTYEEASELKKKILTLAFPDCCGIEGFHIVEHILLRPKDDDYTLSEPLVLENKVSGKILPSNTKITVRGTKIWTRTDENGDFAIMVPQGKKMLDVIPQAGDRSEIDISLSDAITVTPSVLKDPYSFLITVMTPNWLPQFKNNPNGQNSFEQLVRRECPAHIVVKFCWLEPRDMYNFESYYLQWLYENALEEPNDRELTAHVNDLVDFMKDCSYTVRDINDPCFE